MPLRVNFFFKLICPAGSMNIRGGCVEMGFIILNIKEKGGVSFNTGNRKYWVCSP